MVAVNRTPASTLASVKVGKEISVRSRELTSNIIRVATVSKKTNRFSLSKAIISALCAVAVLLAPVQVSLSLADAAPVYDAVQVRQMWAMVKAVQDGIDTDPVHIAQVKEFLASPYAASNVMSAPQGTTVATTLASAPAATTVAPATLEVWWPTAGSNLQGIQPIKALAKDRDVTTYKMYWQVDGGALREMPTNTNEYPHKEDSSVDVNAWGGGAHTITLVARDTQGNQIGSLSVPVTVASSQSAQIQTMSKTAESVLAVTPTASIINGSEFYVDPNSPAARQAKEWRTSRPGDAAKMDVLAAQPTAKWFGGWSGNVESAVRDYVHAAKGAGKVPVLVAYNIPQRDCGGYSAGGTSEYTSWIGAFARGIGDAKAVVILEPDSLSLMDCLSSSDRENRYKLLSGAVSILKANGNTAVYLDAGHSKWIDASVLAGRLQKANVAKANGFVLNVSNFMSTGDEAAFGKQLSDRLGGTHFVIDTSRNGNGPTADSQWCNPWGRAIGNKPTTQTGDGLIDAYLWIKTPGESDGNCNGGPSAGSWWADYALSLVR